MVDDHRRQPLRVEREEIGLPVRAGEDVDGFERIGEAAFLQHDFYADAVGGGRGVKVDQVFLPGCRFQRVTQLPVKARTAALKASGCSR